MKLVFDIHKMQPACSLLQVVFGAPGSACRDFDARTWLTGPTEDMKLYRVTPDELKTLVRAVHEKHL